jgi:hypothetical protein
MKAAAVVLVASACLCGCATTGANFSAALKKPAEAAGKAKTTVDQATVDFTKARFFGMAGETSFNLRDVVCVVPTPLLSASNGLSAFPDALDTIKDVGEKPDDTSFAAYVKAFRKNAANIDAASGDPKAIFDAANKKAEQELAKQITRCIGLFDGDQHAALNLGRKGELGTKGAGVAVFQAVIALTKGIFGYYEQIQREAAVRKTVIATLPALNASVEKLGGPPANGTAYVVYPDNAPQAKENNTLFGTVINIRRWMVAKQLEAISGELAACRANDGAKRNCLGDAGKRRDAEEAVDLASQYRSLAAIDTDDVIKTLKDAVAKAGDAGQMSFEQLLDGLVAIGDALDSVSKNYDDYKKAK